MNFTDRMLLSSSHLTQTAWTILPLECGGRKTDTNRQERPRNNVNIHSSALGLY